jgi:hypothetical protein
MRSLVVMGGMLLVTACSLDEGGLAGSPVDAAAALDASGADGGGDADPSDIGVADIGVPDVPADCKDTGPCTQSIPQGWVLGAAPTNPADVCPVGFATKDYLAQVTAQAGACDCGCTVTKDPVCDQGTVSLTYANDSSCSLQSVSLTFPGCKYMAGTYSLANYVKSARLPPTGGTCTGNAVEDKTKTQKSPLRACDAPSKCAEDYCSGALVPAGFDVCIHKDGDEPTCPAGFATRRAVVGSDFTLGCSACTCDVNGPSACTGTSIKLYNDSSCATEKASFVADGNCGQVQNPGSTVSYAKYVGTLTKACTATGTKAATPTLAQKTTICCK